MYHCAHTHTVCGRKAAACGVDEVQYVFIKRVCQVLVELGTSQIARLWVGKIVIETHFILNVCEVIK